MKKTAILLIFAFVFGLGLAGLSIAQNYPVNYQLKELRADPDNEAKLIYSIPLEVKMLEISEDYNWYKVKISFSFGPLCSTYIGWANIPIGDVITAQAKAAQKATLKVAKK